VRHISGQYHRCSHGQLIFISPTADSAAARSCEHKLINAHSLLPYNVVLPLHCADAADHVGKPHALCIIWIFRKIHSLAAFCRKTAPTYFAEAVLRYLLTYVISIMILSKLDNNFAACCGIYLYSLAACYLYREALVGVGIGNLNAVAVTYCGDLK
jgi:hypothetical protein